MVRRSSVDQQLVSQESCIDHPYAIYRSAIGHPMIMRLSICHYKLGL